MSTALSAIAVEAFAKRSVCNRCRFRAARLALEARRFSTSKISCQSPKSTIKLQKTWRREYFSANLQLQNLGHGTTLESNTHDFVDKIPQSNPLPFYNPNPFESSEPPHRRRKRLKDLSKNQNPPSSADDPTFLPPNSASTVSDLSTRAPARSLRRTLTACLALSKPRLSFLIILTTATAYSLYPVPAVLAPAATSATLPTLSALTLTFLTAGTGLCAASANALNMLLEPEYDAQMSRTRNRPIVRGLIGKKGALVFAGIAGVFGVGGLYFGVNPTVSFLGAANIVLYAGVYTPMKRFLVLNTWVGALVGGIPPLMGWAAAAGQSAVGDGGWRELLLSEDSAGGWLLAGLLFAWQFPHFNSLSWAIREEYKAAGYRMLVWVNGKANGRVALRYAILCFPICAGLWWVGVTDTGFLVTSSAVNGWMVREAWRFWRLGGQQGSARGLFWSSVWHLPVVMVLAMIHKQGLWEGVWNRIKGTDEEDEPTLQARETLSVYSKPPTLTHREDTLE